MTHSEWLESVAWVPVTAALGGAVAVLAFYVLGSSRLRVIGIAGGAVLSVAGCAALSLFLFGPTTLPVLLGWGVFLAVVTAKASAATPRLRLVLASLILIWPLGLIGLFLIGSMTGSVA